MLILTQTKYKSRLVATLSVRIQLFSRSLHHPQLIYRKFERRVVVSNSPLSAIESEQVHDLTVTSGLEDFQPVEDINTLLTTQFPGLARLKLSSKD